MDAMSPQSSGTTRLLSVKFILLSAAALSAAVAASLLGPGVLRLASSEVPRIYVSLQEWMTPPFLYVIVNGIIITIAASSRFQRSTRGGAANGEEEEEASRQLTVEEEDRLYEGDVEEMWVLASPGAAGAVAEPFGEVVEVADPLPADDTEEELGLSRSSWVELKGEESGEFSVAAGYGRPATSARFGCRRSVKGNRQDQGNPLRVVRPTRNDTLESTWKKIMDRQSLPPTEHLEKSNTWKRQAGSNERTPTIKKLDTFNQQYQSTTSRREPSLTQEELNKRVEDFIKKFNEDMRLQRQESLQHYWDMVSGGNKMVVVKVGKELSK